MSGLGAPVNVENLTRWWRNAHIPHQPSNCQCTRGGRCGSIESLRDTIAESTGLSRSTLFRRIQGGTITMEEADRWACALGVTAYAIWPAFDRAPVTAALTPTRSATGGLLF